MYEIERKFYIPQAPGFLVELKSSLIRQGYLAIEPEGSEVRVRQKGEDTFWLTVKSKGGIKRIEQEISLNRTDFEKLWPLTAGRRLEKRRYIFPWDPYAIEIDEYLGGLQGLYTAEVEFPSLEDSKKFRRPTWLGKELTENPQFKNQYLAQVGHYHDIIANL